MNKKNLFIVLAFFSIAGALFVGKTRTGGVASESEPIKTGTITLTIDFGGGEQKSFGVVAAENATAFSALETIASQNNIPLITKKYDFGVFVESIGDKTSDADTAWIYFVNGKSGEVAADKMHLQAKDLLEWKYIKAE